MSTNIIAILLPGTTATTLDDQSGAVAWEYPLADAEVEQVEKTQGDAAAVQLMEGPLTIGTLLGWQTAEGAGSSSKPRGYGVIQSYLAGLGFATTEVSGPTLQSPLAPRQLIGFEYDWRNGNIATAAILRSVLQQIDSLPGGQPYETWLIGHSMGGLLARALLEGNRTSTDRWYTSIKGLITLGAPHLGAPMALDAILNQWPLLTAVAIPPNLDRVVADVANDPTGRHDSVYELLPPPSQPFVVVDGQSTYSIFDLHLQKALVEAGGSAANLQAASGFFTEVLTYIDEPGLPPYYCAYGVLGSLIATTTGYTYETAKKRWQRSTTLGGGDGIVPAVSAQFKGRNAETQQFAASHGGLITQPDVLAQITAWMGLS